MTDLHAWTDGACSGNPGPGGWAAIVVPAAGGWGVLMRALDGETVVKER